MIKEKVLQKIKMKNHKEFKKLLLFKTQKRNKNYSNRIKRKLKLKNTRKKLKKIKIYFRHNKT